MFRQIPRSYLAALLYCKVCCHGQFHCVAVYRRAFWIKHLEYEQARAYRYAAYKSVAVQHGVHLRKEAHHAAVFRFGVCLCECRVPRSWGVHSEYHEYSG